MGPAVAPRLRADCRSSTAPNPDPPNPDPKRSTNELTLTLISASVECAVPSLSRFHRLQNLPGGGALAMRIQDTELESGLGLVMDMEVGPTARIRAVIG